MPENIGLFYNIMEDIYFLVMQLITAICLLILCRDFLKTSFRVLAEVSASHTFFGWVFWFSGKVQILGLEDVKEQYHQMVVQANKNLKCE